MFSRIQPLCFALVLLSLLILCSCGGTGGPAEAPLQTQQTSVTNLRGQYAVVSNSLLGRLNFDGQGNVNGEFLFSNPGLVEVSPARLNGTYTLGSDGRGTAILNGDTLPSRNPTLSFALLANGDVFFIETDSIAADPGLMRKQDPSAFSFGALSGTYALGGLPIGYQLPCLAGTIVINASGNVTVSNGKVTPTSFPAATLDPVSGNLNLGLDSTGSFSGGSFYVVSGNEVFARIGVPGNVPTPFFGGGPCQAERQTGPYSTAAFSQPYTLIIPPSQQGAQMPFSSFGGTVAAFSLANGAVQNGIIDQLGPLNGPPFQQIDRPIASGNFVVNSDGTCSLAVTPNLSATCFAVSPELAFLQVVSVSPDPNVGPTIVSGAVRKKPAPPFSTSSVAGNYGVLIAGIRRDNALVSSAARLVFDGNGNVTGVQDSNSGPGFVQDNVALQGTYSIAANGRGTMTLISLLQTSHYAIYVVSDSELYMIGLDADLITGFGRK